MEHRGIEKLLQPFVQKYNHEKYWKMRERAVNYHGGFLEKLICTWYLYRVKRMDAFHNATTAAHLGFGAQFKGVPELPHGLNGIVLTHEAVIGKNCTIFHQVTIGGGKGGAPVIGDDVMIGPGAKILGGVHIGNRVNIGANAVVVKDVPDDTTVVVDHPRMIAKKESGNRSNNE